MPRAIWSGAISFGLVNIPVKANVATRDHRIKFVQLHEADGERIRYQRTCAEHGEVPYEQIVKGHPVGRGEYVVVTDEELGSIEPEKSHTIEIEDFVALEEVDPIYFDRTYHLVPDGAGAKAYRLLVEAMEETGQVAIGRFVLRAKEHLVALRTLDGALVMELLHYADEVELPEKPETKEPTKKEQQMAVRLIKSLTKKFEPQRYEDRFQQRLQEFVEAKAEGQTVKVEEAPRGTVIEDLEKALEKSLQEVKGR